MITSEYLNNRLSEINHLDYSNFDPDNFKKEPVFPVDFNSRTIKVPKEFETIAVVGDHQAEMVWFIFNRYFDGQDLYLKNWGIQFQNGNIKMMVPCTGKVEGATVNEKIKDQYGITVDHILIGWLITRDVTHQEGPVVFSLRCFDVEPDGIKVPNYSLSTAPAIVKIGQGQNFSSQGTPGIVPDHDALTALVGRIEEVMRPDGTIGRTVEWSDITETSLPRINGTILKNNVTIDFNSVKNNSEELPKVNDVSLVDDITFEGVKKTGDNSLAVTFPKYIVNGTELKDNENVEVAGKPDQEWLEGSENAIASFLIKAELDAIKAELGELTYIPLSILSFSMTPSMAEKGDIINTIDFDWTLSKTPNSLSINGISIDVNEESYKLENANLSENKVFILKALDKGNEITNTINFKFVNKVYWGVSKEGTYNSDFIKNLGNSKLDSVSKFTVNAKENQYIYFAAPAAYPEPIFTLQGSMGGKWPVAATVNYTNGSETTSYKIYRSDYTNLGDTTILIS